MNLLTNVCIILKEEGGWLPRRGKQMKDKKKKSVLITEEALKYCLGSMYIWAI